MAEALRGKFTGVELHGKVLGILGFGRIGQLVAARAKGFDFIDRCKLKRPS